MGGRWIRHSSVSLGMLCRYGLIISNYVLTRNYKKLDEISCITWLIGDRNCRWTELVFTSCTECLAKWFFAFELCETELCNLLQDDSLHPHLTTRETLMFSARLRLPGSMKYEEKQQRVKSLIEILGLTGCADTNVGDQKVTVIHLLLYKITFYFEHITRRASLCTIRIDTSFSLSVLAMTQVDNKSCTQIGTCLLMNALSANWRSLQEYSP